MFNEQTNKYEGYIYCITNRANLKMYIGQTTQTVDMRFKKHKQASKKIERSIYLYYDMRDYGHGLFDVFTLEKIECDSLQELKEELNKKEIFYISNYNSLYPNGYNISKGGTLLPNMYQPCKVYKFDLNGKLLAEYESMSDAAYNNSVSQADISNCCNGKKIATVGGFYWSKEPVLNLNYNIKRQKKNVYMYDLKGNYIKCFNSVKEAAIEMFNDESKRNLISKCARGKQKTCLGYIWKYYKKECLYVE